MTHTTEKNVLNENSKEVLQNYPIQDDTWPSRRWNKERTEYIDLSGNESKVTWTAWGETITVTDHNEFTCFVNPHGNHNAGIPSMMDRQIAKTICDAVNERQKLIDSNRELLEILEKISQWRKLKSDVFTYANGDGNNFDNQIKSAINNAKNI